MYRFLFPTILLLLIAGCISYEQDTRISENGSGSMDIHYWISEDMLTWLKDGALSFNEDSIRAQYATEGVEIESVRSESREADSTRHVYVSLSFDDVRKLPSARGFRDLEILWQREGDIYRFVQTLPAASSSGETMLDEFTFTYRFDFPGDVRESNADSVDGSLAVWVFKLSDLTEKRTLEATITAASGSSVWWVLGILAIVAVIAIVLMRLRKK